MWSTTEAVGRVGGAFQTSIGGAVWFEVRGERVLGKQLTMTGQEPTRRATQAQEPSTMTPWAFSKRLTI